MDPNETLRRLMVWVNRGPDMQRSEAAQAAEDMRALDEWLVKGGFLPSDWAIHADTEN